MQDKRAKHKGRKGNASFLHIPHEVLNSDAYRSQDGWTAKLLVDLAGQFNGGNNGDLCAAWTIMREKGWRSKGTLHKSLNNLLEAGLIEQTRQGGKNRCSLYAVTWRAIDECKGKLDVRPTRSPSGLWKEPIKLTA
ncbi:MULTISPECIES: hypothetical protein [Marinobacter]|uniref:hypothetical protein n=1 Tax=Marinobacter TaxID=2742 RepID=UPI001B033B6F|nr:hypothetical protein [Marinobacter sp.]MBO6811714.1 hypothetical protein [Marinobacter sp.]MBO6875057.1 hypothetical protein [Marinobacter sp.]